MSTVVPPKEYTKEEIFELFISWYCKHLPWQVHSYLEELNIKNLFDFRVDHPAFTVDTFSGLVLKKDLSHYIQPLAKWHHRLFGTERGVWAVEMAIPETPKHQAIKYYFVAKKNVDFWITSRP